MKRNRKNISLNTAKRASPAKAALKGSNSMVASKIKIKNEARKTARSTHRASRSTVKSVPRGPTKKVSDRRAVSEHSGARSKVKGTPLSPDELNKIDASWRAANYLSVGQIYLLDNPLLREPLQPRHIKPRLLGHWGTTPGQNFIYTHLNRVIKQHDLDMIYLSGPGHGGPAAVANTYLEGTYSEIYPAVTQDEAGLRKLFRQFSVPGGIPGP